MFKKVIAAALAALTTVVTTSFIASAAENYQPIKNDSMNYHYCPPGSCHYLYEKNYLGLSAEGSWGFVYSPHEDHKDSYKYISITTYGYKEKETSHYVKKIVNNSGIKSEIISPNAFIDGTVSKVVYNGQVFRTSEKQSGILQKYLIGSFRSGTPIK